MFDDTAIDVFVFLLLDFHFQELFSSWESARIHCMCTIVHKNFQLTFLTYCVLGQPLILHIMVYCMYVFSLHTYSVAERGNSYAYKQYASYYAMASLYDLSALCA